MNFADTENPYPLCVKTHSGYGCFCRYKWDDKPGYVADGHLSRLPVARQLKRPT